MPLRLTSVSEKFDRQRWIARFVALAVVLLLASLSSAQTVLETGFVDETFANVGSQPMGFVFAPDGRMFVWYKPGVIKIFRGGTAIATFLDIRSRVNTAVDRGLVGFALDPNFSTNGFVYLAYVFENAGANTSSNPRTQRVSRFQVDPTNANRALPGSEKILLGTKSVPPCSQYPAGSDCIPDDAQSHTIDHLMFGRDGKLYVSIGDGAGENVNTNALAVQTLSNYRGKLLRVNPSDGSAPGDNPFSDGTNSVRSRVLSYGLRNPFRFTLDSNGLPVIGDVGWFRVEEIDRGKGKNFGWPCFDGSVANPEYQNAFAQCRAMDPASVTKPMVVYPHTVGSTVIGGPFYTAFSFPAQFHGNLFYGDFAANFISRVIFDSAGNVTGTKKFVSGAPGPVFLDLGPDGSLYYVSITQGQVRRVRFTGSSNQPPVAKMSESPTAGLSPLDVTFSSAGSFDPEAAPLTFLWNFGDGTTSTLANPIHRFTATGVVKFPVTLTVKDPAGLSSSASNTVIVGDQPPVPTINTPANGSTAKVGDTVTFNGSGFDPEDGALPAAALTWTVILHHNTHTHLVETVTGTSGSFVVADHDPGSTFSYEIQLTAKDSVGATATKSVLVNVQQSTTGGCTPSTVNNTMTVCSPTEGATLGSPVHVVATATSSLPITAFWIYDNGVIKFQGTSNSVDTFLTLGTGTHQLSIQAWNTAGTLMKAVRNITVTGGCTPSTVNNTMTVCTPTEGATVTSPVHIVATATSSLPITAFWIYVDGQVKFQGTSKSVDTSIPMSLGAHQLSIQAWNTAGTLMKVVRNITVH